MKVIEKGDYGQYLKSLFIDFFSKKKNYFSAGAIFLLLGLVWYGDGLWGTFKLFAVAANGFAVAFFLTEVLMNFIKKEFKRNKLLTYVLIIGTLTSIIVIFFNKKDFYWSYAFGLIFMIPFAIAMTFIKLRIGTR